MCDIFVATAIKMGPLGVNGNRVGLETSGCDNDE